MLLGLIGALLAVQAHAQPYPSPILQNVSIQGTLNVLGASTFTGPVVTAPSITTGAGFSLPPGVAPTAPVNGNLWITASGMFARINGATVQIGNGPGSGTVTSVSVATANGFGGTVASSTTTPVISLSTSVTGLLKGNGTAVSAAAAGSDYLLPTGSGASLTGLSYSQLPVIAANTLLGALTSATPSALAVPSCSGSNQGLNWTSGTGFGCVTFSGGGGALEITDGTNIVNSVTKVTFPGTIVSGTSSNAFATPSQTIVTYTGSHAITAGSDNGVVFNMTGGGTLTINAISSSNLQSGVSFIAQNGGTTPITISSTPTIKIYGSTTIPVGGAMACTSDGTNLWCPSLGVPPVVTSLLGSSDVQSGATYTLAATDCGRTVFGSNAGAMTWTIPAAIVPAVGYTCIITVINTTANKISVNGSAVTAASLQPSTYTGTASTAYSEITLTLTTVGSTATAVIAGNAS